MSEKSAREKLEDWVEKNPDGYKKRSQKQIANEAGVSQGSVSYNLKQIIAKRDGILPSEVTARREKQGFRQSPKQLTPEDVAEIHRLYYEKGYSSADIAHILNCHEVTVRKYIKAHEKEHEED